MPRLTIDIGKRIDAMSGVLSKAEQTKFAPVFENNNGDLAKTLEHLREASSLSEKALGKVRLAYALADWSDDNVPLVKLIASRPEVSSLRDVARNFSVATLAEKLTDEQIPATMSGETTEEKARAYAVHLHQKLYRSETAAVLSRMAEDNELPIEDIGIGKAVARFLDNQPDFDIRKTSIYTALKHPEAFKEIDENLRQGLIPQLKTLQRVQALSPVPQAVPQMMKMRLTAAPVITAMPQSIFLRNYGPMLGEDVALQVYDTATTIHIRNEHALMTMYETVRGQGMAAPLSKTCSVQDAPVLVFSATVEENNIPLSLDNLFGDMDFCECDECLSVYSPAAYFVDLLQYLRHNNFGPDPQHPDNVEPNPNIIAEIENTPLGKLFERRPDLGCLELTCENTFTVMPYVDLANEIMEYWVVNHRPNEHSFNVADETSGELLAEPQHTNYQAYCILKNTVYPFNLPYHQPIDAARVYLNYLGTSRHELLDTFRRAHAPHPHVSFPQPELDELEKLVPVIQDRAVDAEYLGMTQEDYIILTREAFWPQRYFEITQHKPMSQKDYQQKVGVKDAWNYYNYNSGDEMLSIDESKGTGLTFVKKQFLPRTGIQYTDLVEILKTRFINPYYPQGKALKFLESICFSYRFLQRCVDPNSPDRFEKLVNLLEASPANFAYWEPIIHANPCNSNDLLFSLEKKDIRRWVECYLERLGELIVLESGEGPYLPIEGTITCQINDQTEILIGTLDRKGIIRNGSDTVIGFVGVTVGIINDKREIYDKDGNFYNWSEDYETSPLLLAAPVYSVEGKLLVDSLQIPNPYLIIKNSNGDRVGGINELWLDQNESPYRWIAGSESCDLEKVRLVHLNGNPLTEDEYDRIQRFIRLWHRTGWTIDETDQALMGLACRQNETGDASEDDTESSDVVDFNMFTDDCSHGPGACGEDSADDECPGFDCPDFDDLDCDITPDFLHQLVAVRKLEELTGLDLPKLLAFWADIGTMGEKSLYARLFLTHNMLGIDKVFQADDDGNYLTEDAAISEHLPVLMATLRLTADDIAAIMKFCKMPDVLTLANVSTLYRCSLLAKLLHLKPALLPDVISLFGDPFASAHQMLELVENWGRMEDAGFTFAQLNYLLQDRDDALRPLAPSQRTVLQLAKTLYDGLNAIDGEHPDLTENDREKANADLVRTKAGMLFETQVVEQIIGLLEGTTVYTTNAPSAMTVTIPEQLSGKLLYKDHPDAVPPQATLQATGILTEEEMNAAKAIATHSGWGQALERIDKQPQRIIHDALYQVFTDLEAAKTVLLAGDVTTASDQADAAQADPNTAPVKRLFFLQHFMPFLRRQLAHRFIVETLAGTVGLANDITDILLTDILVTGVDNAPAIVALEQVKAQAADNASAWSGYLIPAAGGDYIFIAIGDTQPPALLLDGLKILFPHQQEDPSNVWLSDPVKLNSGKLYRLEAIDRPATALQWKTATSPRADIPASMLLPDYSATGTGDVLIKLQKAGLLINGFGLDLDEITFFQTHAEDFGGFDFNAVTLPHWLRLHAYTTLRDSLPKTDTRLLDLFQWACQAEDASGLTDTIAAATLWDQEKVARMITAEHFDLNRPESFRNEVHLVTLQKALKLADKIRVDADRLFNWAEPSSKFWRCHAIARNIYKALRSRYDQEEWEQVIKPLNDELREHQKQALISYQLVQQELRDWGVVDADSLFEYFLIDVQMDPCFETSRIKQAISSVQLFVQRCMLGLEAEHDVCQNALDRQRWDWMQRYRVWEANRKIFLYPENWILSQLRDDKSPFYKELESELLQKDINQQAVEDALKSYLYKVDEVANMQVAGLFLEQKDGPEDIPTKLHIFARTRNAPYFYYYRYYDVQKANWYPWEKVQVDIPNYNHEDENGQIDKNGTYLIPVVWNKRLLIFFPQFMKKTAPKKQKDDETFQTMGEKANPADKPNEYWEIKMGWSEYRNGKWTQKQLSEEAIYNDDPTDITPDKSLKLPDIRSYEFIPRIEDVSDAATTDKGVTIFIHRDGLLEQCFLFTGNKLIKTEKGNITYTNIPDMSFHWKSNQLVSLQSKNSDPPIQEDLKVHCNDDDCIVKLFAPAHKDTPSDKVEFIFYHTFIHQLLGTLSAKTLENLFDFYFNLPAESNQNTYGAADSTIYNELKRPYALYNWEIAFHAPMQLVESLLNAQQFEQALKMCHFIFDPQAEGEDVKRFWKFIPFSEMHAKNVLENLFKKIQAGDEESIAQVNEWRDNPFMPHVVARSRPTAYMKWVVMKYIEILIAWGDYLFRQDTIESINQATQLYVLASHVYGPRGYKIPKRGKVQPHTYLSLKDRWDAFSNAMVELELVFPFSNQTPFVAGLSNGVPGFANIFGFATTLYFCIPDNPKIRALRETIDDRLFKIRHCLNIEGVFRKLPLFEPPIDPTLLVQAAAQGLSLASVLNDLNSPMPNYRFYYLLQKAQEMCGELKALGSAYLSAKEKLDAEELSQLRARHESTLQTLVMEIRTKQLEEAQSSLAALEQNRIGAVSRMQYQLKLIGEDLAKVPDMEADFTELPNAIAQPIKESDLRLNKYEKQEMDKAGEAKDKQNSIEKVEILASVLHGWPNVDMNLQPLGTGTVVVWGPENYANIAHAVAKCLQIGVNDLSYDSTNAGRKAGHLRQLQERIQQANAAGYEIKNLDKQILTQQIRIELANQEITNQQKNIDHAQEVEDFLRNKYTNQELYQWMAGQVTTLYRQAYEIAYELAKKAEKVYRFERGLTSTNFLQGGFWEPARDGLLSGERLSLALKRLETAYQEHRGYDFEISRSFSLRRINPLALIRLKETGQCEFTLPEVLFDMDYPGHYMRRIKSVAMTVPCVVGPYTSLNCTLRLTGHRYRINAVAKDKSDYAEKVGETDERFSTVNVPIASVALSSGQNDSGMFELNFKDERYLPFEGAGAISTWRIELPNTFRQFDYDTISDVILHLRYTAKDGGNKLKQATADFVQQYVKDVEELSREEGLFAFFDLKHDFANEWYQALHPAEDATERLLALNRLNEHLPYFTQSYAPKKIQAIDVYLFSSDELATSSLLLLQGTDAFSFSEGTPVGSMKSHVIKDIGCPMTDWSLKITDMETEPDRIWMVIRYTART